MSLIGISETQIVFTFFHHFSLANKALIRRLVFPTLIEEGNPITGGADLIINGNLFFQFKRPEYLVRDNAREISDGTIPANFLPYFRFNIKNDPITFQFDTLMRHAQVPTNIVMYISPLYHNEQTYFNHFQHLNSSDALYEYKYIDFSNFVSDGTTLSKDNTHVICYNDREADFYLFSNPKKYSSKGYSSFESFLLKIEAAEREFETEEIIGSIRSAFPDVSSKAFTIRQLQKELVSLYSIYWIPVLKNHE